MSFINMIVNRLVDGLLWPFVQSNSVWTALAGASLVASILLLLAFRVCSDQSAIRRKKKRISGHLLELLLFQHDLILGLKSCGRILLANLSYLREYVAPLLCTAVPVTLLIVQLACWFESRPLLKGEPAVLEVTFADRSPPFQEPVGVSADEMVIVETDSLRIPQLRQVNWRLRAAEPGRGEVGLQVAAEQLSKSIVVGNGIAKLSTTRTQPGLWNQLVHPVEAPLPSDSRVESIRVRYPPREFWCGPYRMNWLLPFVVLMILFSLVLGRICRVAI
ncbi:MAG: hypothetical protein DWQ29_04605 [Planctomycetota bacterium]|nr:MAG: hypothetical protein DWQ29_04605 [Planctomycetota bacterium]